MEPEENGENDGELKQKTKQESGDNYLIEKLTNIPEVAHIKTDGRLGKEADDKTHGPDTEGKTEEKEKKAGRQKGNNQLVFLGREGWLEEIKEEVEDEWGGKDEPTKHAGGDAKLQDLVGGGEDHINATKIKTP